MEIYVYLMWYFTAIIRSIYGPPSACKVKAVNKAHMRVFVIRFSTYAYKYEGFYISKMFSINFVCSFTLIAVPCKKQTEGFQTYIWSYFYKLAYIPLNLLTYFFRLYYKRILVTIRMYSASENIYDGISQGLVWSKN